MEGYFPVKLKRKDLDEVSDDFCDFSLSSPARKIRRLDAELPPIMEEEEMVNPVVFEPSEPVVPSNPIAVNGNLPVNEERAIILYDPMSNAPTLQSRSPFSFSVNSDFLSGFKNPAVWSNRSNLLKSLDKKADDENNNSEPTNGSLAVIPWIPPQHPQQRAMPEATEMMEADDDMEVMTMDIEDNNTNGNAQELPKTEFGHTSEGMSQWQQHCMIPQADPNLSTPVSWSAMGYGL